MQELNTTIKQKHEKTKNRIEAVGLRSMKVKRLREEKAARARELRMKIESATAGKRKRDKKMLEAAIKIQVIKTHGYACVEAHVDVRMHTCCDARRSSTGGRT